jgi:hypothetical protein
VKKREVILRSLVYGGSAALSGGGIGFLYTAIVYLIAFGLPPGVKFSLLIPVSAVFILHEWNVIRLPVPQNRWQVPHSWVSGPPMRNMAVWGLILGAGILTYIPHIIFHLLYLYLGFFKAPVHGLLFGALYGFSRALPAVFFGILRTIDSRIIELDRIPQIRQAGRMVNGLTLLLFTAYLILRAMG